MRKLDLITKFPISNKAFRLGEATWWQSRTPPKLKRDIAFKFTDDIVKGIFSKFGYLIADVLIQRDFHKNGSLIILGNLLSKFNFRKRKRLLSRTLKVWEWSNHRSKILNERLNAKKRKLTYSRLTVYLLSYIQELLNTYLSHNYTLSFREIKKVYRNSDILTSYITKNKMPIIKMIKRVNRKILHDSSKLKRYKKH